MASATWSEAEVRSIATATHGRYLLRRPAEPPALLLVGFHGYRENATRHLAELERIPGAEAWALLAVDALHAFYAGSTGEVLRGWMTRELREEAIADNVAYVRRILDIVRPEIGWTVPLAFLGFSQGASMAWRAAAAVPSQGVIALGGDVPPDVAQGGTRLPPALLGRGRDDTWYTQAKLDADLAALAPLAERVETVVFDGGHEWTDAFRQAAGSFLAALDV